MSCWGENGKKNVDKNIEVKTNKSKFASWNASHTTYKVDAIISNY